MRKRRAPATKVVAALFRAEADAAERFASNSTGQREVIEYRRQALMDAYELPIRLAAYEARIRREAAAKEQIYLGRCAVLERVVAEARRGLRRLSRHGRSHEDVIAARRCLKAVTAILSGRAK